MSNENQNESSEEIFARGLAKMAKSAESLPTAMTETIDDAQFWADQSVDQLDRAVRNKRIERKLATSTARDDLRAYRAAETAKIKAHPATKSGRSGSVMWILDADGGFLCGDATKGEAEYAYPTSGHARAAKRNALRVAREMLADAYRVGEIKDSAHWAFNLAIEIAERDHAWIARLTEVCGV